MNESRNESAKTRKGKSLKEYFERWLGNALKKSIDVTNADFQYDQDKNSIKCLKCDTELSVTIDSHGSFKITTVVRHLEKHTPKQTHTPAASNKKNHEVPTTVENQGGVTGSSEEIVREVGQINLEIDNNNGNQPKKIRLQERENNNQNL